MGGSEKFCLRWNDFETNISGAFRELREDKDFFDVTLACDDDQIQAHKLILSACSPFFRTILRRNRHEHPLLYLKGVKYADLVSVLNFMYHGEVNVAQEELNSFLAVAEDLKVKGLTQNSPEDQKSNHVDPPKPRPRERPMEPPDAQPKRPRPLPGQPRREPPSTVGYQQQQHEEVEIQEVVPVKSEPPPVPPETPPNHYNTMVVDQPYTDNNPQSQGGILADPNIEYGDEYADYGEYESGYDSTVAGLQDGNKDLDMLIAQSMSLIIDESGTRVWNCDICNRSNRDKANTRIHVETHFPGFEHQCPHCEKQAPSREALRKHIFLVLSINAHIVKSRHLPGKL